MTPATDAIRAGVDWLQLLTEPPFAAIRDVCIAIVCARRNSTCTTVGAKADIAIRDNRMTGHYAIDDSRKRRLMHRVTMQGDQSY